MTGPDSIWPETTTHHGGLNVLMNVDAADLAEYDTSVPLPEIIDGIGRRADRMRGGHVLNPWIV